MNYSVPCIVPRLLFFHLRNYALINQYNRNGANAVGMSLPHLATTESEDRDRSPIKHFFVWGGDGGRYPNSECLSYILLLCINLYLTWEMDIFST